VGFWGVQKTVRSVNKLYMGKGCCGGVLQGLAFFLSTKEKSRHQISSNGGFGAGVASFCGMSQIGFRDAYRLRRFYHDKFLASQIFASLVQGANP